MNRSDTAGYKKRVIASKRFTYLYPKEDIVLKGIGWSVWLKTRQRWRLREKLTDLNRVVVSYQYIRIMLSEADLEKYFTLSEWKI